MRISIGADHRGFGLKNKISELLRRWGHEVHDHGTNSDGAVDYPDYAAAVARQVGGGSDERGILICGSGLGMCIAANKIAHVRAVTCHDELSAQMSRRHNDSNVLCLSADLLGEKPLEGMIGAWLDTPFEGGRHSRRVEKIGQLEQGG